MLHAEHTGSAEPCHAEWNCTLIMARMQSHPDNSITHASFIVVFSLAECTVNRVSPEQVMPGVKHVIAVMQSPELPVPPCHAYSEINFKLYA